MYKNGRWTRKEDSKRREEKRRPIRGKTPDLLMRQKMGRSPGMGMGEMKIGGRRGGKGGVEKEENREEEREKRVGESERKRWRGGRGVEGEEEEEELGRLLGGEDGQESDERVTRE
ncbi:hypothetical protein ASPWEDRAFT_476923 [Aspergillus wentii DTO 134E9]|uniref:Uncharacterized protein n=1 Tax=Aspergillus wentii DTO 134E9 TaxID=1073089 RepID=A0A1L9RIM3_ASPWE|nr:uncharacterized protein ASPWEDRAFT_476923 [Aspergillus wentii DTO 134E9]OJJ34776.1 hypothetical protein ASPWEDRAFT_476923 [Aspergillus wentii DTO 134E9]